MSEHTKRTDTIRILENAPKTRKPFAVDLSLEQENIAEHGNAYMQTFLDNMKSFALETDTSVRYFSFKHALKRHSDGHVELFLVLNNQQQKQAPELPLGGHGSMVHTYPGEIAISAKDSYIKPLEDFSIPAWERERAQREYEAILALEKLLEQAQEGDTFIEASNAPFDQDEDALQGTFYGAFSFIRTHTLTRDEHGREILQGAALRHYLDWQTQTDLFGILAQKDDVTPQTLLGTVGILQPPEGLDHVRTIQDIDLLIEQIDSQHKVPHDTDTDDSSTEKLHAYIDKTTGILKSVFRILGRNEEFTRDRVLSLVTEWRHIIRDFCAGKDRSNDIRQLYIDSLNALTEESSSYPRSRSQVILEERYSSCGFGIGFADNGMILSSNMNVAMGMVPSYGNLAAAGAQVKADMDYSRKNHEGPDTRKVSCPSCKKTVEFSRSHIIKTEQLTCDCGACAKGCAAVAIAMNAAPAGRGRSVLDYDLPQAA